MSATEHINSRLAAIQGEYDNLLKIIADTREKLSMLVATKSELEGAHRELQNLLNVVESENNEKKQTSEIPYDENS